MLTRMPGPILRFAQDDARAHCVALALLTLAICLLVNVVVGNVLSPRIQGQAVRVHPLVIFLAVVAGGELFGLPGVVLAVPTAAMLRVLNDFLRVRVRLGDGRPDVGR